MCHDFCGFCRECLHGSSSWTALHRTKWPSWISPPHRTLAWTPSNNDDILNLRLCALIFVLNLGLFSKRLSMRQSWTDLMMNGSGDWILFQQLDLYFFSFFTAVRVSFLPSVKVSFFKQLGSLLLRCICPSLENGVSVQYLF
jgi:hypothetical protein